MSKDQKILVLNIATDSKDTSLGFAISWLNEFSKTVTDMPEVMEFHRMAGDVDYMLKVIVADIESFDKFYKRLIGSSAINEVTSRFSMEKIKETTELPL